ncbi:MAG: sigma-70 family RNA polymerase sigma factor [Kiritimatiellae bacterium]|nr:sigma-70 family RNA polymerase sigma factor [Kiritimatiellia bacterium]
MPLDWTKLIDQYGPALLLYARQWTPSHADAEEVVQEGFVRFWRAGGETAVEPAPRLFAAVRRAAIDLARSRARRAAREQKAGETLYEEPAQFERVETGLEREERRAAIERALGRLPPEQREVLVMKIWGDLTFSQIGETLGISPNTAASRYRYALAALRDTLGAAAEPSRHRRGTEE